MNNKRPDNELVKKLKNPEFTQAQIDYQILKGWRDYIRNQIDDDEGLDRHFNLDNSKEITDKLSLKQCKYIKYLLFEKIFNLI